MKRRGFVSLKTVFAIVIGLLVAALLLWGIMKMTGCEQKMVHQVGGTMTVDVPPNMKMVAASWKEMNLWYLYRPAHPGEVSETWVFQEKTPVGVLQGKVIFEEHVTSGR